MVLLQPYKSGQAVKMLRPYGNIANVNYYESEEIPIPTQTWGMGISPKTITGGLYAGGRVRMEAFVSIQKYTDFDPGKLVTHEFHGLESIPEAFKLIQDKSRDLINQIVIINEI